MMLRITCPCGHVGVAEAATLPRSLTCSACGESRHVEAKDGERIKNPVAFEEWLLGASGPRGSQKKSYRRHSKDFCQTLQRHRGGISLPCFQVADVRTVNARSLRKYGLS
jgi:hypothetical protein